MSENTEFMPELTLTPNEGAAAQAAAPEAPGLTLEPTASETAVQQADQAARDANAVKLDESMLSEPERKMVDDFAQKIDIRDSNVVLQYGAAAQKNIAGFSESALSKVRTKDLGEVGDALAGLVGELQNFGQQEEKGGILGFFQKKKNDIQAMKAQYSKAETNVNQIVEVLEGHQVTLMKDVAMLDQMYELNTKYYKELTMYILAGKKKLEATRAGELEELRKKATASGKQEDAQAYNDLANLCGRFEKKLHDLELTRMVSIQMGPQVRLIQNNDALMLEKLQSSLVNTIPLWKSQMVLALGMENSRQATAAQSAVTNMTNDLLRKNADLLKMGTIETAREAEKSVVSIEALQHTNQQLISTLDEMMKIQTEGAQKRKEAEAELGRIEGELKKKLLELRG
ncbi:MAG: toxic anion resistance protein [Oscillospiraceae bacterium]|jgi:uncharacterized protein YaaN involved in tellurite resistance